MGLTFFQIIQNADWYFIDLYFNLVKNVLKIYNISSI